MKPANALFLVLLTTSSIANAGMKVSTYLQEKNSDEIKIYITGVANGFAFSNTELESHKKKAIFCPPSNLLIKVETYMQMLDEKITTLPKDKVGNLQIEPMLLDKLIEVYPCRK
jgi:hypothetical protein